MTAGLISPAPRFPITQGFMGDNPNEPPGYLQSDAHGPLRAKTIPFADAAKHTHLHKAIDIGCPVGTPIIAPERGLVVAHGTIARFEDGSYDGEKYVLLLVNRSARTHTVLLFTHLSKFSVPVGEHVRKGQRIALSGATGRVTGPHLHWEVRVGPLSQSPLASWGKDWVRYHPQRCMEGHDLASRSFLIPNV